MKEGRWRKRELQRIIIPSPALNFPRSSADGSGQTNSQINNLKLSPPTPLTRDPKEEKETKVVVCFFFFNNSEGELNGTKKKKKEKKRVSA
eukprot:gene12581-8620_t